MKKRLMLTCFLLNMATCLMAQFYVHPSNGRVGIGTTTPATNLHLTSGASTYLMIEKPDSTFKSGIQFSSAGTTQFWLFHDSTANALKIKGNVSGETDTLPRMELPLRNRDIYLVLSGGLVGINTNAPSETLDVNGGARIRSLAQNDTLNQVMVSDTNGKIFWRDASSITGSLPFVSNSTSLGVGSGTLVNSTSHHSTAFGVEALSNNSGNYNTAIGYQSMGDNNTGSQNTAVGYEALLSNTTGGGNTAIGRGSCMSNTTGYYNTGLGRYTLTANSTGNRNTAVGFFALNLNSSGNENTAVGYNAGPNGSGLSNTTAIGHGAVASASDQVRIGNSSVTSIGGQVSWSTLSDGRFKRDIRENISGLEFIKGLRPVSYNIDRDAVDRFFGITDSLKKQNSPARQLRQTGFVAQEVEALVKKTGSVFNGVEAPQNDRDHYSIRYAEFVVPLVKAVQELSTIVEDQQKQIDLLTRMLATTEIQDEPAKGLQLHQNQPNPFKRDTKITMFIPEEVQVATLYVYDLQGKKVEKLEVNERGSASVIIEGGSLSSGIYLYTLIGDSQTTEVKRMILTE